MRLKHDMLALVAMLSSFTFSAYAQQVITVSNAAELREALTGNDGIQQSASLQRGARAAMKLTIELDAYTDPSQVQEIIEAGYDVTLNLNGCTLIGDFTNKGSLTIVDETGKGAIIGSITNEEGATLTLESGNIIAQGGAAIVNKGTANFNGGSVTGEMTNTGTLNGEPTAATIGDAATLQAAINAAVDGQVIKLAADITGDVTVVQKPGVKFTIDGAGKNFKGSITVDGKSAAYPTAGVTIQNVNFVDVATGAVCINLGVSGNNNTRYTSNVTVQNCTFTGTDKTAAAIKSYTGGDKQLAIIGCTATGMHSLAQLKNVAGVEVTGCKVIDGKNGISLGVSSDVAISQTEMDCTGYGVRADANAAGGSATITNSEISAMIPVVVRKATADYNLTFGGTNTIEASNEDGIWCAVGLEEYGDPDNNITLENIGDATGKVLVTCEDEGLDVLAIYGNHIELSGEGTQASPYQITNIAELYFFRDEVNAGNNYAGKYVQLAKGFDLAWAEWTPIGTSDKPFNGVFDGNGNTISNLMINAEGKSNIGFFGRTNSGEIKNLTISNAKVTGRLAVGVVAGQPYTSKYTNIKVTGHVEVNGMAYVGGVGGRNAYADWTDITVDVDAESYVKANSVENGTAYRTYVGGVIGFNGEGSHTFKNISSNIKVIGSTQDIGGIFGILHYSNNAENITFTGTVEAPADAEEVGAIAGVWHNQQGTDVEISDITSNGSVTVGGEVVEGSIVGGAYNAENVTPSTSGSLKIDGKEAWLSVAKIGDTTYRTLAEALAAAQDGATVTLLWGEGDAAIAMNGAVYGKTVTITGTAAADWNQGFLFVGRGGEGNGTVIFDGANLTSASNSGSYGIHVSGREKNTNNKYDGTLVIKNSTIELDYLINKGAMTLDNAALTVKNGFAVGGRPASETESGEDATATMTLANGSKLVVNNHNGMGLGYEAIGVMDIDATSTFECTADFLVTAKGTMNVNGGAVKVAGKLSNLGNVNVAGATVELAKLDNDNIFYLSGNNTIKVEDATGSSYALRAKDGVVLNDSYVKSTDNATVRFLGSATLNGGFSCAYLQGASKSKEGIGGTVTIEEGTTVKVSYGVEFSNDYTLNGGTIELAGGNASGSFWGCVFQSGTFKINTDVVVDGNGKTLPVHFTNATATINANISQSNPGGEVIYLKNSEVTVSEGASVASATGIHVNDGGKLYSAGDITGNIKNNSGLIEISGGSYTQDVTEWCIDGFFAQANADGTYTVTEGMAGSGTAESPFVIKNITDLKYFREQVNGGNSYKSKVVKLTVDIDLNNEEWAPIGTYDKPFNGTFDGGNCTVSNLKIDDSELGAAGFFGYTKSATIKNLNIKNVDINAYQEVGAIAGTVYTGKVDNCHVSGSISLVAQYAYAGGITSRSYVTVTNSSVIADGTGVIKVVEKTGAGGITGWLTEGNHGVKNCTAKNLDITAWANVGGITGFVHYNNTLANNTVENVKLTKTREDGQASIGIAAGGWSNKSDDNYTITVTGNSFNNVAINGTAINSYKQDGVRLIGSNYSYYINIPADKLVTADNVYGEAITDNLAIVAKSEANLEKALTASDEGDVITIGADIELTKSYTVKGNRIIDLNGYTISGTDKNEKGNFYLIDNRGNLTITDGSEAKTGKIILTAETNREWSSSSVVVANNPGGKLTVNGGTIEHLGGTDMAYAIDNLTNGKGTYAETIINGGTVKSPYRAVRQFLNGVEAQNILTVNGGTIKGTNKSIWMQDPSKNANTGTLTVGENAVLNGDVYLYVTAGSTEWPVEVSIAKAALQNGSEVISGNIPAGYEIVDANGTIGVYRGAAKIDNNYYASFATAIAAVKDNETITLLTNCAENVTITQKAGLSFTIDGAGNTYTGIITVKGNGKQSQVNDHSLTISNVNFVVAASTYSITTSNYAHNITVDGCRFIGSGSGYGMKIPQSYNVTVKNTTGTKLLELVYSNKAVNKFTAENVTVTESSHGFYMSYGVNMSFKSLNLNVTGAGVYTNNYNSSTATFEDCTITAKWGVYLEQKNTTKAYTLTFNGTNSFDTTGDWLTVTGTDATFKAVLNDENLNADNIPNLVAKAGNVYSNKFLTTFEAAQDGDTVTLLADVAMDTKKYTTQDDGYAVLLNVKGKAVTLDLNGKKLTVNAAAADLANAKGTMLLGVFSADLDGNFTITDSSEEAAGAVEVIANDAKIYSVFVSESAQSDKSHSGKLVVNNGSFTTVGAVANAMFFSDADEVITINGGNFHLDGVSTGSTYPWMINTYDNNQRQVIVTGGTFNADINHQHRPFEVKIAETLALQNNGNGTWTIVPAEAYVTEMLGGTVDEAGNNEHKVGYATFEEAIAAVNELGKTVTLLKDVVIDKSIYVTGKNLTLDGAGHTFTQAEGLTFGNYLVPLRFNSGEYTIKNVVFDGWTSKSVLRIENATAELDNVTIQNTNWNTETQAKSYGVLYVENSDITVKNSKFLNNVSGSTVTYGYGSSDDMATQLHIDNCLFENNTSNGDCSIIYYVKGSGCTITNSEFISNKVNCNTNGATVYLGFMENCSVTGNLFKDNQVVDASTSTRVAGAVFFGYDAEITGNAFDNNTAANANGDVLGQVCTSLYYTDIDLSGNYWGEAAPEYGTAYTIQHQTTADRSFVLASYYTAYELDADGNLVLGGEDTFDWTFVDGEFSAYTNKYDMEVGVLTYKRNNIPTTWTPFYVPFEVPVSQLADKFEVAYINGVRRNDTDLDGELDVFEMEVIYIHGGNADGSAKTLKANYPYFIRSKNGVRENLEITLEDITLYAAKDATYDCTTMTEKFEVTGNSSAITLNSSDALRYGVSGGKWSQIINDQVLKPFRFYMTVSSRDNSEVVVPMSTMSIAVRGEEREDGTTLIYDVENDAQSVDYIYDLQGRRVLEPQKGSLYIINGKKVIF